MFKTYMEAEHLIRTSKSENDEDLRETKTRRQMSQQLTQPEGGKHRNQANARERDRTHRVWNVQEDSLRPFRHLEMRSQPSLETSETDCPVTRPQIPEERRPYLHHCESLNQNVRFIYCVNSAFTVLRTLIPTEPADRKLSKIETLRLASSYISHLGAQLLAGPVDQPCLRLAIRPHDNFSSDYPLLGIQRSPVCTFCLTNQKKVKASASQGTLESFGFTVPSHGGQDIIFYPTQTSSSVNVTEMNSFF